MTRVRVLSPIGDVKSETVSLPSLPATWSGRIVGFLDNTKTNFDRLTDEIGQLLRERHGVKDVMRLRKANASTAAPPEMIVELAKACDVVFAGSGD